MEAGTVGRAPVTAPRESGTLDRVRRLTTETKSSLKTSELWLTVAVIIGVLVSAAVIAGGDTGSGAGGSDEFIARQAWLIVAIVTGAYAIGRGLAKSGSREPYTDRDDH
jgi:hypothetical protein